MKPTPHDWPRISATLFYDDPRAAIEWLCKTFGFTVRMVVDGPNNTVAHSELEYGGGLIMVSGTPRDVADAQSYRNKFASPKGAGGHVTQSLAVHIDNADAHCAHAREHGAEIVAEPTDADYGPDYWCDRNYAALDCEGHVWWFMQRVSTKGVLRDGGA
ncbi:MAG: VOC family protein [Planctomycetota bacterium]